jgi:hypothetical protein
VDPVTFPHYDDDHSDHEEWESCGIIDEVVHSQRERASNKDEPCDERELCPEVHIMPSSGMAVSRNRHCWLHPFHMAKMLTSYT